MAVKPIPDGFHTLTPYLAVRGAAAAIDWYKKAFGAEERYRMPMPDGKLGHAEIKVGDSVVMLGDEVPQMGCPSPQTLNGSPVSLFMYTTDVDASFQRAVAAGATVQMPPTDMFWGDRFAKIQDPFGHLWAMATHKEDLTDEQIKQRAAAAFGKGHPTT
jgi:PhnB protein